MTPIGQPKNLLVDTNILLSNGEALLHFQDNLLNLSLGTIAELDRFKRDPGELGRNARQASRLLDALREHGRLTDGVPLPNGGTLRVLLPLQMGANGIPHDDRSVDEQLILLTQKLQKDHPTIPAILVTKDINLRILADAMGVRAEDYKTDHVNASTLFTGTFALSVSSDSLARLHSTNQLPLEDDTAEHFPNEYCCLTNAANPKQSALARINNTSTALLALKPQQAVCGIRARNREQQFALDALCNPDIPLVTLTGPAGTGKTLLTLAAGLHQILTTKEYGRLLVTRPTVPVGRDLGFLPGDMQAKLDPWMTPVKDALDMLEHLSPRRERTPKLSDLFEEETIKIEGLSYWRGRSLAGAFIIVDESQNLSPLEGKTACTRVGSGSKIVFLGDLSQIDTPYLDRASSGLSHIISKFRSEPIAAHVELVKGERSQLAELAARLL